MSLEIEVIGIILLSVIMLIIFAGFSCYMLRYLFSKGGTNVRRTTSEPKKDVFTDSTDRSYASTLDEEPSAKFLTFDQILKREERSAYDRSMSLHSLHMPPKNQDPPAVSLAVSNYKNNHVNSSSPSTGADSKATKM